MDEDLPTVRKLLKDRIGNSKGFKNQIHHLKQLLVEAKILLEGNAKVYNYSSKIDSCLVLFQCNKYLTNWLIYARFVCMILHSLHLAVITTYAFAWIVHSSKSLANRKVACLGTTRLCACEHKIYTIIWYSGSCAIICHWPLTDLLIIRLEFLFFCHGYLCAQFRQL